MSSLKIKRKNALAITLLLTNCFPLFAQNEAAVPLKPRQLAADLYIIDGTSTGKDDVPNVAIYVTGEGVVLVDPWFAKDHDRIVAAIKSITNQPIRWVIDTHYHSDHTGGNAAFAPTATIIGHANTRKHMVDHTMPGPPSITFTEELTLFPAGKEVRLRYLGPGHTDGDIAVYFPEWKAICLGDMMAGTRGVTNPVVDYANGGTLAAWPASLDRALAFDDAIVIPGHGALTDRNGLAAHRAKVEAVGKRLRSLVAEKKTKPEIQAALIAEFDFKAINLMTLDRLIAESAK